MTTETTFGWGIVGTGHIARQFAADLAHAPGAALAAVCSRDIGKARDWAATHGAAIAFDELDALLADPAVDAVYVATPNSEHLRHTLAAIRAGKPVLTEKPLATSAADAALIRAEAERFGVFAMEAMWTRFLPAVREAKRRVAAGAVGEIVEIRADLSYRRDETAGGRFFDPKLGGGAALDLGVYPVSLAIHLLGLPDKVSGSWVAAKSGVDMRSYLRLVFRNGAEALLSCGFDRDGENSFVVHGTQGTLRLEPPFLKAQRLTQIAPGALHGFADALATRGRLVGKLLRRMPLPGRATETFGFPGGGLQFQAIDVMRAVRAGETSCATMPLAESEAVLAAIGKVLAQSPGAVSES